MTHRAESIITAVRNVIATVVEPSGTKTYVHRRDKLDSWQDELPAISVDFGEDTPADQQPLGGINSELAVVISHGVKAPTEAEVREKLLELREQSDALMDEHMHTTRPRLGLTFVYGIGYGGAAAPEINTEGESVVGWLSTTWNVGYRMR